MSIFDKKKQPQSAPNYLNFSTRAEAFNYMLNYMLNDKCVDPMEAAEKANEFAEIFSANMGIPLKKEPKLEGVDKYISMAEKIGGYIENHPKVVEYGLPVATFVVGLFTGKKVEEASDDKFNWQQPVYSQQQSNNCDGELKTTENCNKIDFDKID